MSGDVIPDEQTPMGPAELLSALESETVETVTTALEEMAEWLVGSRGPMGGVGGVSETFENDVVQGAAQQLVAAANGWPNTPVLEGNWLRSVTKALATGAERHALDTRLSLSALGNSVGASADNYDAADRAARDAFGEMDAGLDGFLAQTNPGMVEGSPPSRQADPFVVEGSGFTGGVHPFTGPTSQ